MAQMVSTEEELDVLLESLGDEPSRVAEFLQAAGVRGRRECADACPVANWLVRETGAEEIEVDVDGISLAFWRIEDGPGCPAWHRVDAAPGEAVRLFINQFDEGAYPQLEDQPTD